LTVAIALGLVAALGSAVALNWGYVAQHEAASALPPLSVRRPLRSLRSLFADRRWLVGFLVGIGGWALYVAALRVAPLSLVQAVSAGGIGILALLAWRLEGWRPGRRELVSLSLALGGLVALAGSFIGGSVEEGKGGVAAVAVWLAGSLALAALVVGYGGRALRAGVSFGIAAGVLYAAGDVATKAAVGGGGRVLFVLALLGCHGLAFVALQLGFQRDSVLATAGLSTLFTNAVPILAGIALFGEGLPRGWAGVLRAVAFAAVVVGGAGLSRDEVAATGRDEELRSPSVRPCPVVQVSSSR
jgi:hypothetical protein